MDQLFDVNMKESILLIEDGCVLVCRRKLLRKSGRFVKAGGWELDYIRVLGLMRK